MLGGVSAGNWLLISPVLGDSGLVRKQMQTCGERRDTGGRPFSADSTYLKDEKDKAGEEPGTSGGE